VQRRVVAYVRINNSPALPWQCAVTRHLQSAVENSAGQFVLASAVEFYSKYLKHWFGGPISGVPKGRKGIYSPKIAKIGLN